MKEVQMQRIRSGKMKKNRYAPKFEQEFVRRLSLVSASALYCFFFVEIYTNWASPNFHYLGLTLDPNYRSFQFPAILLATLPSFFLGTTIRRFSDFFVLFVYFITISPAIIVTQLQVLTIERNFLTLCVLASFFILALIPKALVLRPVREGAGTPPLFFWQAFSIAYLVCFLAVVSVYWETISIVGFDEIYDQRERAGEVGAGRVVKYFVAWLGGGFNAYLIASGILFKSRRWMVLLGVAGQIFVFSIFAGKVVLISTIGILSIGILVKIFRTIPALAISWAMAALLLAVWVVLLHSNYEPTGVSFVIISQIFMRGIAIQGAMLGVYADYFAQHQQTFGSHISGVNLFIQYPYEDPLGIVIGKEIAGGEGFNANSSFLATDGIAAFGLSGVILMGAIIGLILSLADKFISKTRLEFACVVSVPFIFSAANVSIFTSLLTGGGLVLIALMYFGSRDIRAKQQRHARPLEAQP